MNANSLKCLLDRFRADRRAVASVEFGLEGVALFAFLLAIINLGDLGLVVGTLKHGVQAAAHLAAVQTDADMSQTGSISACATSGQIATAFNSVAAPILPAASAQDGADLPGAPTPALQYAWTNDAPGNAVPGTFITMTAHYLWTPLGMSSLFAGLPLTMSSTQMVLGTSGAATTCT